MQAKIFNKNESYLGIISFNKSNMPILKEGGDDNLLNFIEDALKNGIKQNKELVEDNKRVIYEVDIKQSDSNFPLAFLEWLRRHGYKVEILHPEVDKEIDELSKKIPKDNPIRKKIAEDLPNMTYLEKTFILEVLRKTDKRLKGRYYVK